MDQEIDSLILHARNAPRKPGRQVPRDNVLDTIDRCFESSSIVFLAGDSLSGKSDIAAQYMRRHEGKAVGAFLTHAAPIFYSSAFLRLTLAEQIHLLVYRQESARPVDLQIDEATFNQYVLRFQSLGRRSPITFVIDGLAEAAMVDRVITLEIFNQLPAVQSEFKFLISGSDSLFRELNLRKKEAVKVPLFLLSLPETAEYLSDLQLPQADVRSLQAYSSGNIGLLQKLRSLLAEGVSLNSLLNEKRGTLDQIFEYEWNSLNLDETTKRALALIAISRTLLNSSALAQLVGTDLEIMTGLLAECRLVEMDPSSGAWSIRSDAQRRFVADRLNYLHDEVEDKLIARLLDHEGERESTLTLPAQLLSAGRHSDALQRLNGDHFAKLLQLENSLRVLKTHAEYGVISARSTQDIFSELRFSLIQSTINGTTLAASTTFEIEALLALGQEEAAAALALTAATPEERLRQLASAASAFAKRGKQPPEQVLVTLRQLLVELEDDLPEPVLIAIAAELFPVDVDLSLQILGKASSFERRQKEGASLTQVAARGTVDQAQEDTAEPATRLEATLKMRPLLDAAALFVRKMSASEVLRIISDHEETHKLFILQRWIDVHRRSEGAADVALTALDLILKNASKAPKIKDIREVAVVAPHINNRVVSEKIVARLEAQSSELIGHGTSEEAVRLQMLILRTKQRWHPDSVDNDLIDLFAQIHEVSDVGIRTACYAWMLYHLGLFEDRDALEERTGVIAETTKHLLAATEILLSETADHYGAAIDAIRAICMADAGKAIDLVSKFNTEARRNKGFGLIIRCVSVNKTYSENAEVIARCVNSITDRKEKEKLILFLLFRMCSHLSTSEEATVDPRLLILWKQIVHSSRKTQALVLTYKITRLCSYLVVQKSLLEEAKTLWVDIQESWLRIDVGYWTVAELAEIDPVVAEEWLVTARGEAKATRAPSAMACSQLFLVASLAGRIFAAYVASTPSEFDPAVARVSRYVHLLDSPESKAAIWTEIGIQLWFKSKRDLSQRIVESYIEPLLSANYENNKASYQEVVFRTAPLLYLTSAAATNGRLDRVLAGSVRDDAREDICIAIMRKMLASNPYQERERTEFDLTYADASDILSQIKLMNDDSTIFKNVSRFCDSLAAKRNRGTIRRNQVADILVELKTTVECKLPDTNNIKHDGFLIASLAQIHRCQISETKARDNGQWLSLLQRAQAISNGADRVIVVSLVASCANGNGPFSDGAWFDAVLKDIRQIPSDRDRIERFQWVAEILGSFDRPKCRIVLKEAMRASNYLSADSAIDKRQKILDLAHSIDPEFVNEMVEILDDDEANSFAKTMLKDHSKLLEAKKEAASNVSRLAVNEYSIDNLTEIAFRNVAALNAGRQIAQPTGEFMQLIEVSKRYPFPLAYPVWLWIVECSLRKATQQSASRILPLMFDFICSAADVSLALLGRSGGGVRPTMIDEGDTIAPGARSVLYKRIREWVAEQDDNDIVYICDPYFGPDELDIIRTIAEVAPEIEIVVVTSKEHMLQKARGRSIEEVFGEAWDDLCEGSPPKTEIVVIGFGPEGKHPIHDRWIVSESSGLRLGTSTGSMGYARVSEVSQMDRRAAEEKKRIIATVLNRETRQWDGQRLHRARFTL